MKLETKGTLLFLMDSSFGHISATLRMAYLLHKEGYKIVYAISGDPRPMLKYFEDQPFDCHPLYSLQPGFESFVNKILNPQGRYLNTLMDKISEKSFKQRQKELLELVHQTKPIGIFQDFMLSSDFLILYPLLKELNIKYTLLQTKVSTNYQFNLPPPFSPIFPNQKILIGWAWMKYGIRKFGRIGFERIIYLGYDSRRYLTKKVRKNNLHKEYPIDFNKLFGVGYKGIPELIISSKEFDYPKAHFKKDQYHVGPMVNQNRKEILSNNYLATIKKLEQFRAKNPHTRLIYCGLGSLYMKVPRLKKDVILFIKKLYKAFANDVRYQLIINIHRDLSLPFTISAQNFHQFDSVPQIHLLKKVDAFITHGGMNSIKEAILCNTPLLVYPLDQKFDQNGNAARVVYHNLGLMGNIRKDTESEISDKLKLILNDSTFRMQIQSFHHKERQKYPDTRFLELFYGIMLDGRKGDFSNKS